ncbi:MAG: AEC family transporter [Synergistaceae bacterium]|nr:AEC family transporter [Synergistaceae bacterium]
MNLDFFVVMSNLVSLFVLIAVGYAASRYGIIKHEAITHFSALLMKITLPCTIFISLVQKEYDPAFINDSVTIIIAGLIVFPAMLYISRYLAPLFRVNQDNRGVWAFACTFTNSGFMGFPIALALFGPEGLVLAVMLNIAFNMSIFTLGALELSRDNPNHKAGKLNKKSIIFSSVNISIVLSLIFYFGQIPLPEVIATPVSFLSNITTPLSMALIGIALANSNASELFADKDAWSCTFMKLAAFPVALALLLKVIPISSNPLVSAVLVIVVAMPAPSITVMLCEMYGGNLNFAAKVMFLHNLLCLVSIPLVCMLLS